MELKISYGQGFSSCSSNIKFDKNALDKILSKSPIRCDEAQFEIFQVSLAGWNGLISMMIFIILLYLLYKEKRSSDGQKIRQNFKS